MNHFESCNASDVNNGYPKKKENCLGESGGHWLPLYNVHACSLVGTAVQP